ncbi:hypothetical protein BSL78_19793 [Apostichopus japonicus]|uniref:Reverse transcriptase domain-containing protein n=1 Tax=Stichopus japonicus TaxID=307972 RepID=A0A2G8K5T0_STIJA|nr:hypothetical protein BSL78_19793 [Apostichopus japonicus]
MQKLLLSYVTQSIDEHGDPNQFAYRKGISCTDAILTLVHGIVSGLNCKQTTISKVLFLDFSSAFNTVLPNRLLNDLCNFIDEPWLIHWLRDFMQGWSRQVKLDKGYTTTSEIRVGVPQGGPLSALLFTIYTDCIRSNSNCSVIKYADDTVLSCNITKGSHQQNQHEYQDFITSIVSTCDQKNLLLNKKKCKEMVFENINIKHRGLIEKRDERTIIHNTSVERTSSTMYLGVCIDNKLTFSNHISKVLAKVYHIVATLMYIAPHFPVHIRERVFEASILPNIIYAVPVWYHFVQIKDKKRLLSFLTYCERIFGLNHNLLKDKVNTAARKEFERLLNNIQRNEGHPLHCAINSLCNKTNYNLRNAAITPRFRIELYRNSFVYRASMFIQHGALEPLL